MFPFDLNNLVFLRNRQIAWYGGQNLPDSPKNAENSDFEGDNDLGDDNKKRREGLFSTKCHRRNDCE